MRADFNLFEDGKFAYNFEEGRLNVAEVKDTGLDYVLVPFSINGFRITSFCPVKKVNGSYDKLYLGSNVESVGENTVYLGSNFSTLREINVDPANKFLTAYKNVLYNTGNDAPHFIPPAITRLELKLSQGNRKEFHLPPGKRGGDSFRGGDRENRSLCRGEVLESQEGAYSVHSDVHGQGCNIRLRGQSGNRTLEFFFCSRAGSHDLGMFAAGLFYGR